MSDKRLAIIVPYRNRKEHLEQFLPHVLLYFDRDKLDKEIPFSLHVVEQAGSALFNRGKLLNIGFDLTKADHDYFCLHDVDYLPIWADYSYPSQPTRLIWWGLTRREVYDTFFGAVIAVPKADFVAANGYPNEYWGWGGEDLEFGERCILTGRKWAFRDGSFQSLPHPHACTADPTTGLMTKQASFNLGMHEGRVSRLSEVMTKDGLSTLRYRVKEQRKIPSKSRGEVMHHVVEI